MDYSEQTLKQVIRMHQVNVMHSNIPNCETTLLSNVTNAVQITLNSTWVIVNTFKANQYELPLYDGMCPNIFLMLCFQDYQKGHEAIVFNRLTLTVVF